MSLASLPDLLADEIKEGAFFVVQVFLFHPGTVCVQLDSRLSAWTGNIYWLLALTLPGIALAETLAGRVVGITDGDTLTLLVNRAQYKVRLTEIDTPEKGTAVVFQSYPSIGG